MTIKMQSSLFYKSIFAGILPLAITANAKAASFQRFFPADYADPDVTQPTKFEISGISQDGSTLYGNIDLFQQSKYDCGFYLRNGQIHIFQSSLGLTTGVDGISADGTSLLTRLDGGETLISNLGTANESSTVIPGETGFFAGSGGNAAFGGLTFHVMDLSADGKTVAGQESRGAGPTQVTQQYTWSAASGTHQISGSPVSTINNFATAVSANGSVVVGRGLGISGMNVYRAQVAGTNKFEALNTGLNNTGGAALTDATAVSADGNTVLVRGGLWHENVNNVANFQNYQTFPGYNAIVNYNAHTGLPTQTAFVDSSTMVGLAMTPDASWVAGGSDASIDIDPSNPQPGAVLSAQAGWIYSAATGQTYELTQFLVDHGINISQLLTSDANPTFGALYDVTGLSLVGNQLTLVGNTNPTAGSTGWEATVTVPEPTACAAFAGVVAAAAIRRRRGTAV